MHERANAAPRTSKLSTTATEKKKLIAIDSRLLLLPVHFQAQKPTQLIFALLEEIKCVSSQNGHRSVVVFHSAKCLGTDNERVIVSNYS